MATVYVLSEPETSLKFPLYLSSGLQISTSDIVFIVSEAASITCTSDLDVASIEWLYGGTVISSSTEDQLEFTFSPVTDTLHNADYTCRVTSPYGIQEDTIQLTAISKISLLRSSIV